MHFIGNAKGEVGLVGVKRPEKKCLGLFLARYNLPSFKASATAATAASEPMTLNCQALPFRE